MYHKFARMQVSPGIPEILRLPYHFIRWVQTTPASIPDHVSISDFIA